MFFRYIKTKNITKTAIFVLSFVMSGLSFAGSDGLDPRHSSSVCNADKGFLLTCDYRYSAKLDVKEVQLEVDGKNVQVKPDDHRLFPATKEQTAAVLILADVSDPKRSNTVEVKYGRSIGEILRYLKPHQQVGLAEFDSEIRVLAPIGADINSLQKASQALKATGQATEFYKNILAAIDLLKKSTSERKGLVILSDGKDEDRAYKFEDVIKLAKENNITILSLGYLESQQNTPFLQSLKRLADETHGLYFDVSDSAGALPLNLAGKPLAFIEKGGRITYQLQKVHEAHKVNLFLGRANGEKITLSSDVVPPDDRTFWLKTIDFVVLNWLWVALGTLLVILVFTGSIYLIIKRIRRSKPVTYATLIELNGMGTKHKIQQTAIRIGRGADNDIRLMNDSISSHHAEIHRRREGDFYIVDLASTNGVFVNDEKVHQGELKNNDIIELGEVRLRFGLSI
jgi:Mg-chelatase subunit ChlD